MPRKCDNWLQRFRDWCHPRSESPDSFLLWTGLFVLAAVLRKQVKIPRELLGGWECYPNIYVVLVGPPGVARTSTTMGFGDQLIKALPEIPPASDIITQAALLQEMVSSPDGSIYITATELADVIQKSKTEMFEFLTSGYDTSKAITARTIMRGKETVEKPCINFFACTQPGWIVENIPQSVITGGFASRTIFILEEKPRKRQMYYLGLNHETLDRYKQDLIDDLVHISQIEGEFQIEDEALDFMEDWYRQVDALQMKSHPSMQGYYARRHVHAHKIAMLLHLAYSDDLVLNVEDFKLAISQLEYTERRIENLFKKIGKNEFILSGKEIRDFVNRNKKVARRELLREFESVARPSVLDELIQGQKIMGFISEVMLENEATGKAELFYVGTNTTGL
jgi:hypothetical protein